MNEQARPKAIARRITRPRKTSLVWNTAYKGIDDWQLALRQEEAKEKAA